MRRTNIYLEDAQCAALDTVARAEGISRAELIRRLLDRALVGPDDDSSSDLAAIRETAGALRDVPVSDFPRRTGGAREEHLERVWKRT